MYTYFRYWLALENLAAHVDLQPPELLLDALEISSQMRNQAYIDSGLDVFNISWERGREVIMKAISVLEDDIYKGRVGIKRVPKVVPICPEEFEARLRPYLIASQLLHASLLWKHFPSHTSKASKIARRLVARTEHLVLEPEEFNTHLASLFKLHASCLY